jgi:Arc/MetJ-type ribon-helix-helix transcriptional regulator
MGDMSKAARAKISTTVAPENYRFLTALVKEGKARNLAEAVDEAVENLRRTQNRRRLAQATSAYFDALTSEELAEEEAIATSLHKAAKKINFDNEL